MVRRRLKFLILGLPRSRTAWVAAAFTLCHKACVHDADILYRDAALDNFIYDMYLDGLASTGMWMFDWFDAFIDRHKPKIVILRRPPNQIMFPPIGPAFCAKLDTIEGLNIAWDEVGNAGPLIWDYINLGTCPPEWRLFNSVVVDVLRDYVG